MSVFLTIPEDRIIYRGKYFFMIYDAYPVSKNHLLIISNELREDYNVLKTKIHLMETDLDEE